MIAGVWHWGVVWLLLFATFACGGPEVVYERTENFAGDGWAYADSVSFDYVVGDTAARYDLVLTLGHSPAYPAQNFYVRLNTHLPDGTSLSQPLSLDLANEFGEWYGDCDDGVCSVDLSIQEGTRFLSAGKHRLVVSQFTREDPVGEIASLSFKLIKR